MGFTTLALSLQLLLVAPAIANGAVGQADDDSTESTSEKQPLAPRYEKWLEEVDPLISLAERRVFLGLTRDHHREAFIRQFWRVRDPFPKTARNELRERWDERMFTVQIEYDGLSDDRARILLVHGPPNATMEVRCSKTRVPVIVWMYANSDQIDTGFILVFVRSRGLGPARLWRPGVAVLTQIFRSASNCINGNRLAGIMGAIQGNASYDFMLSRVVRKPKPRSEEWVATFAAYTTDVPEGAERFSALVDYAFLGRYQSRTLVQGAVQIPVAAATIGEFAGYRSYDFVLSGEVVIGDDELFESFRYKFGFPADDPGMPVIPLAFQRYLRPGDYTLILKLEDLNSHAFFRHETKLTVPLLDEMALVEDDQDNESMALFREATAVIGSDETAIRLVPPLGSLHSGQMRFDAIPSGDEITKVSFVLDERPILTKNRPPFNVEIDLGPFPRLRKLRVEAFDRAGRVVAEDEILLNAGEHRFGVRLVEPRRGRKYEESLQARAVIDMPPQETLERVEFFLNETLVATLYQEPWVQPIRLPTNSSISYVRAVAHLVSGSSTEDLVFVNSPDYLEEIGVQFVELYAAVLDREGRLIEDLEREEFSVFEDGRRQTIKRFEKVENLPIHTVILIDSSASMAGSLDRARRAALQFFQQSLQPRDKAAVITFNRFPNLAVKFTNDHTELGGALQGLTAEGQTAFYDSLMFSLYYFSGIKGQRAVLLLSDGKDEVSRFGFDETLEYARRAGVTIYSIGLGVSDGRSRRGLIQLANETGGRSYFIRDVEQLASIYRLVEQDLRSQYLIAYQSENSNRDNKFRTIELKVDRPKATVRTLSGYYP